MRTRLASLLVLPAVLGLVACGGDDGDGAVDARRVDATVIDATVTDAEEVDAPDIDAAVDAMTDAAVDAPIDATPTPSGWIALARAAADGSGLSLTIEDATVTYLKPVGGTPANDPAGFTIQAEQQGPALMIAVDPATLTPVPAVGDVVSFTITAKATVAMQPRATAITGFTVESSGADVGALAQDVSAATDLVSALGTYDSELIDVTGAIAADFTAAGTGFVQAQITTAGIGTASSSLTLRVPTTIRDGYDLVMGCNFTLDNTPVHRFNAVAQLSAFVTADYTLSGCPAPVVLAAAATSATTVNVTFSRNVDPASLMADGSQFTFDNGLTASAATVSGRTVTVTTGVQVNGTMHVVTVANSITDMQGTALGTPSTAAFAAFVSPTHLVINEVDYDQPSDDLTEFIEIYNPTPSAISLANVAVVLVNGGNNADYARCDLSSACADLSAGGYLLVHSTNLTNIPGGTLVVTFTPPSVGTIQNGAPDGIALINTSTNTLIDALSYEGSITAANITGFSGSVSLVEGTAATVADTGTAASIGRVPNGLDTDNAASDWAVIATPTPGAAN